MLYLTAGSWSVGHRIVLALASGRKTDSDAKCTEQPETLL